MIDGHDAQEGGNILQVWRTNFSFALPVTGKTRLRSVSE